MELEKWERYTQVRTLGSGAFGTVYLCRDELTSATLSVTSGTYTEHLVAVKAVPLAAVTERESAQAMAEVAILRSLPPHPNVLRFLDCFVDADTQLCMVTEYVDGGDLAHAIQRAKKQKQYLEPFFVVDVIRQILEGLAFLHSHAILHRDIKPANIYLTLDGVAKIGDLGVAKLLGAACGDTSLSLGGGGGSAALAVTFIGTPFYICPELCMGLSYSYGADVWAVGVTAYELYCLKLPFFASNVLALANIVTEGRYDTEALRHRPRVFTGGTGRQPSAVAPPPTTNDDTYNCEDEAGGTFRSAGLGQLVASIVEAILVVDPLERPTAQSLLLTFFGVGSEAPRLASSAASMIDEMYRETSDILDELEEDQRGDATEATGGGANPSRRVGILLHNAAVQRSIEERLQCDAMDGTRTRRSEDEDEVRRDDDDDGDCVPIEPPRSPPLSNLELAHSSHQQQQHVLGGDGWAAGTMLHKDPQRLEQQLRERALLFHQRRHAKLKQLREDQRRSTAKSSMATSRTLAFADCQIDPTAGGDSRALSSSPAVCASRFQDTSYGSRDDAAIASAFSALRDTKGFMDAARAVARKIVFDQRNAAASSRTALQSTNGRLPFDPPRIHFSDASSSSSSSEATEEEEEEDKDAASGEMNVSLRIVVVDSTQGASTHGAASVVTIPSVTPATSLKALTRRCRVALRKWAKATAKKKKSTTSEPSAPSGGAACRLLREDAVASCVRDFTPQSSDLSVIDADGDYVSCATARDWKHALKDHLGRLGVDVTLQLRCELRLS